MKILNKFKLQQTSFHHSSDAGFDEFQKICKNVLRNHTLFSLMIPSLSLDNPLCFIKNITEQLQNATLV